MDRCFHRRRAIVLALAFLGLFALCGCERSRGVLSPAVPMPVARIAVSSSPLGAQEDGARLEAAGASRPERACVSPAAFLVRDLGVKVLSSRSARVAWTTPLPADSELRWGNRVDLEKKPIFQPELQLCHWIVLTDLEPDRTYYCQAISRSADGKIAYSELVQFRTYGIEPVRVVADRPRIFFRRNDLPVLQARIRSTHARQWNELVASCSSALSKSAAEVASGPTNYYYARAFAFSALLGGNARFRDKALEIALACARMGATGETMAIRNRLMAMTAVYDWNHAAIPDGAREELRNAILAHVAALEGKCNDREYVWGHSHGNRRPILLGLLALCGEVPGMEEKIQKLVDAYRDGDLATWRHYTYEGGSLKGWWYTTWTLNMEVEVFSALKSATGIDWYASEPWFEALVDWYLAGIRADNTFCRSGDSYIDRGLNYLDWIYALNVVHHYKSGRAKWLAEKVLEVAGECDWILFYDILWNDPSVAPLGPSGSLSRHFRAPGMVVMRDSWLPDAVLATFRSATDYTSGHTHLDNNSFTVFCRGGLAIDSGAVDVFGGSHHRNYSSRTIAHNTILVYDPEEKFTLYGKEYANDGGQRWLVKGLDARAFFPGTVEEALDPRNGYRAAGIVRYEDTDEYTYSLGDATRSYAPKKLRKFERHFFWLKRVEGTPRPAIVVFDEVESTKPEYEKTYLLHTQNAPEVRGTVVTAQQNGGQLTQITLLPRDPRISVVGGEGQEFLVGGRNYPPARPCRASEEPGRYRVEISPPVPNSSDRFLHVLHAAPAGEKAPRAALLACEGAVGASVGDWAIVFAPSGARMARYVVRHAETRRHLIVGLVPGASYDLFLDGTFQLRLPASLDGLLRFDSLSPGKFEIAIAVESGAPLTEGAAQVQG